MDVPGESGTPGRFARGYAVSGGVVESGVVESGGLVGGGATKRGHHR